MGRALTPIPRLHSASADNAATARFKLERKANAYLQNVAPDQRPPTEVWEQVAALPPSEERAKLQVKLGHAATRLARQISAKAEAKKR